MVKIRYAGNGVALSSRTLIEQAIANTSAKFDNNIVANRFEQVGSHYEVTIKCVSSRGKGAKRGVSGRRTSSCCWHAWSTFFDELFKLNPAIVIIAQGNRITRESGNWIDRNNESEMCDCETNGWVRDSEAHDVAEHTDSCGVHMPEETPFVESPSRTSINIDSYESCRSCTFNVGLRCVFDNSHERPSGCPFASPTPTPNRQCGASCRHNSANNDGVICNSQRCMTVDLLGWEPVVTPTVDRVCATCRYSHDNTASGLSECPPGRCLLTEGLQHWEQHVPLRISNPTPPGVRRHCTTCRHSITHNPSRFCPVTDTCKEPNDFPLWELFVEQPSPRCVDCAYSRDRRSTVKCQRNRNDECLVNGYRNFVRWVDDPTPSRARARVDCTYSASHNHGESCACPAQCLIGDIHRLFVKWKTTTPTVVKQCSNCKYSYANSGILCYTVIGRCGSGNPKWELYVKPTPVIKNCETCNYGRCDCHAKIGLCTMYSKWTPLEDNNNGFDPERYLQQPTVMPEEKGYMDFEGVM